MTAEKSNDLPQIHIVSYTHWDREFRFDFEHTRMWLVHLMDNLLEIMHSKPGFRHFNLDGQYTLLDDYLEVRPEREQELRELAQQGRIEVGPWYSLIDTSSVHGESIVRNLLTGTRKSDDFGGSMKVGYNVFSFGQIAQLPQIYAGFGIDFILFYKHMDPNRSTYDEFIWEAPDGTRATTSSLGAENRWNFFMAGQVPIVYDMDPWHKDWRYEWGTLGKTFHTCEKDNYAGFHFISEPENTMHPEKVREGFDRTLSTLKNTAAPEHLLFFDGIDFTEPQPMIPEIVEAANKELEGEYEVHHSSLSDYVEAVRPLLNQRDLGVVTGEMKDGPVGAVHTDVCSIHPELKRENGTAENKLYMMAEPFATAAWMTGTSWYPKLLIDKALKYLYQAQVHDSLHGVGPAEMVSDIRHRLQQADTIAETIAHDSMRTQAARINTAAFEDTHIFLSVFNPSPFKRTDVLEAYVDVPAEITVDELYLENESGEEVEMIPLKCEQAKAGIYHPRNRNMPFYVNRFKIIFEARDIPATGCRVFKVKWKEQALYPYPHDDWDPVRTPYESMVSEPWTAENDFVRLSINQDGTFDLVNKETGSSYEGLNYFIDSGEAGNLYCHRPLVDDMLVTSRGEPAEISLETDTPFLARFAIRTELNVPKEYDKTSQCRTREKMVQLPVRTEVALKRCSPEVEVTVTVDNKAKDHFFRVCFPTGIQADKTHTGGVFDVNEYSVHVSRDGKWRGQELTRHQQHGFMDFSDGQEGFAVLNDTLRDYEVTDVASGTIAQSLVRSAQLRIPCDNRLWKEYPGDDSAQALEEHTTYYAIYPHKGDWQSAELSRKSLAHRTPLRVAQIGKQEGDLPASFSFLEVSNQQVVVNAVKRAEDRDSVVLRLYNPTEQEEQTAVTLGAPIREAYTLNLDETRLEQIQPEKDSTLSLSIPAKKIVTVELVNGTAGA